MSFFKKLFGKPENPTPTPSAQKHNNQKKQSNEITLLFPQLPQFAVSEPVLWAEGVSLPLEFDVILEDTESLADVTLGPHRIKLMGFSEPLTDYMQRNTIHMSNWPDQAKQVMYAHRAHLVCSYESGSDDPAEQLFALYKVAAAFAPQNLLGVIDKTAMTANPVGLINDLFGRIQLEMVLNDHDIPYAAWIGILKLVKPDGEVWWVSRGHERFGAPDLAHLAPLGQGERIMDLFEGLLKYMYFHQARIETGHTAEMHQTQLRFVEPYEYQEYIESPTNPALVVEIIEG
jgi:hypothetical protein